LFIILL
jgi:flagellar biosynthesis/type III secretory pathway M-ring protein FliF/YscJ